MKLGIVDDQEAVVKFVSVRDCEILVLPIELLNFNRRRLPPVLAVEPHLYTTRLLRQNLQCNRVGIRIDQHDLRLRTLDQARDIAQRIELRSRRKDSIRQKVPAIKGVKDLFKSLIIALPIHNLHATQFFNSVSQPTFRSKCIAISDECPHNANIDFYRTLTSQHA